MYRGDRLGHVRAVDLLQSVHVEILDVETLCQAHVAALLAGLDQLSCVATVAGDVEGRSAAQRLLVQQLGRLQEILGGLADSTSSHWRWQ